MAHPPDRLAHEENILYLMIELDDALARKTAAMGCGTSGRREPTAGEPSEEIAGDPAAPAGVGVRRAIYLGTSGTLLPARSVNPVIRVSKQ